MSVVLNRKCLQGGVCKGLKYYFQQKLHFQPKYRLQQLRSNSNIKINEHIHSSSRRAIADSVVIAFLLCTTNSSRCGLQLRRSGVEHDERLAGPRARTPHADGDRDTGGTRGKYYYLYRNITIYIFLYRSV